MAVITYIFDEKLLKEYICVVAYYRYTNEQDINNFIDKFKDLNNMNCSDYFKILLKQLENN